MAKPIGVGDRHARRIEGFSARHENDAGRRHAFGSPPGRGKVGDLHAEAGTRLRRLGAALHLALGDAPGGTPKDLLPGRRPIQRSQQAVVEIGIGEVGTAPERRSIGRRGRQDGPIGLDQGCCRELARKAARYDRHGRCRAAALSQRLVELTGGEHGVRQFQIEALAEDAVRCHEDETAAIRRGMRRGDPRENPVERRRFVGRGVAHRQLMDLRLRNAGVDQGVVQIADRIVENRLFGIAGDQHGAQRVRIIERCRCRSDYRDRRRRGWRGRTGAERRQHQRRNDPRQPPRPRGQDKRKARTVRHIPPRPVAKPTPQRSYSRHLSWSKASRCGMKKSGQPWIPLPPCQICTGRRDESASVDGPGDAEPGRGRSEPKRGRVRTSATRSG